MRQSELKIKTRRQAPSDETSKNASLLIRAGFVHKEMAGVYAYLPLGLRVIRKIENIIRNEINAIGGEEVMLTALQDPDIWKKTDRWDDEKVDIWFKTRLRDGGEMGLGMTHEEQLTNLMRHHISSHKDLPAYLYQIQTKFRNEPRARSGLLRMREFDMKDLYSFNRDEQELDAFFEKCRGAYEKIFDKVGIGDKTYLTFASGGIFSKYSYEFQSLTEAGEDLIYVDDKKKMAVNKEVYSDDVLADLGLDKESLREEKAVEVGNLFKLGTKFSEMLGLTYKGEDGKERPVVMGSYGIGTGRLMATVVEICADDNGLVWPESISPFSVHLIELEKGLGEDVYKNLVSRGIDVLYDDRDAPAGEKFMDADLIGIPWRAVVSSATKGGVEIKRRTEKETEIIKQDELAGKLS